MAYLTGLVSSARIVLCCTCLLTATLTPQAVAAQGSASVPIKHAESNSVEAIHFFAAQKSKDGLVLIFYGTDASARQAVLRAAGEALNAGYPLRGVVLGPVRDDAPNVLEFYADAQLTATFLNPDETDGNAIVAQLKRNYVEIVQPRRSRAGR